MYRVRGHHVICLSLFRGLGYDSRFIDNVRNILKDLETNPEVKLKLVEVCDDVCSACPHKVGNECRKREGSDEEAKRMDSKALRKLGLKVGDRVKAREALRRTRDITAPALKEVCGGCEWLETCLKIVQTQ